MHRAVKTKKRIESLFDKRNCATHYPVKEVSEQDKHFLVLEGDEDDAFLIRRAFRTLLYCSCYVCRSSSEAKSYLLGAGMYSDRSNFPRADAVITELRLELESGESFIEWVRTEPGLKTLPVVVLAGVISRPEAEALARLNVNKLLVKPSDTSALKETLALLAKELCST
jgi:CheY-like chemotaxis protein